MFIYRVIDALDKAEIPYAIVGGFAVALHGAVRGTVDLDLIVKITKKNLIALEKSLQRIGLRPRLPVTAEQIFDYREDYIKNRNLIAWSFYGEKSPTEVVDVIMTHDLSRMTVKKVKVDGRTLKILNIKDLILMKKECGMPQDMLDIEALEKISRAGARPS